jgi:NADPH:quinone reductase-like Zn-dependent oxidoreductase
VNKQLLIRLTSVLLDKNMKAVVCEQYGAPTQVLAFKEVEKPMPKNNEVLVQVHAASLNAGDWHILRGEPLLRLTTGGLLKPRHQILGDDIAGRVEAVGRSVQQFQPGDEVFGISNFGAFAEYRCVPEDNLALKPTNVSFEDAATIPMVGFPTLQALRDKGQIQYGHKVLINGASGGVGTFAIQLAKFFRADVTGVCSTRKLDMVRSIGADYVIDYTQEDFTKREEQYDLILAAGGHHSIFDYKRALCPEGSYICIGGSMSQYFQALLLGPLMSLMGSKKMGVVLGKPNHDDLVFLMELVEAGKIVPVIDRRYPLHEVAHALQYLEEGHAKGKVVIIMTDNNITK